MGSLKLNVRIMLEWNKSDWSSKMFYFRDFMTDGIEKDVRGLKAPILVMIDIKKIWRIHTKTIPTAYKTLF